MTIPGCPLAVLAVVVGLVLAPVITIAALGATVVGVRVVSGRTLGRRTR
jgi:hypothetical protein